MEKTGTKELKPEVVTFSYLQNRRVRIAPIKRPNSWKQKFKIEKNGSEINDGNFMLPGAKSYITLPLDGKTGMLPRVLDNTTKNKTVEYPNIELTEQEFFERSFGLQEGALDPNRKVYLPDGQEIFTSFWKGPNGQVVLQNEAKDLDLSQIRDMFEYKILSAHFKTIIAPSMHDQNRKQTYKYVIVDIDQAEKEYTEKLKLELQANDEFNVIKHDIKKMLEVIWLYETKISESTNIDYVKTQCYKLAKEKPVEFLNIIKSPFKEQRLLLLRAIKTGVVIKTKNNTFQLRDGYDIGLMESAWKWLKNPENFDRVELIKQQIDNTL